ncbi:type II toxin-antitoxin system RelE family toxin [Streptomyces spiralis]|uniref:type II toxin-antitoxin system RelE family toxin n=1 Tax=Streptomyces spiralis TaxID=66376 RepID=UPI003570A7FC
MGSGTDVRRRRPGCGALRILHALSRLCDDPYREDVDVKKLSGHKDLYRLRVGVYRIAYMIDDGKLVILVVEVGHRREIYRRLRCTA